MARLAGSSKLLRAMNESATLALLLERGTLTRGELREVTGLSKPTTSEVLRRLTEAGLAVLAGHTTGGPGPNAEIYRANPSAAHAVAVTVRETADVSTACLSAALCDLAGTVVAGTETIVDFGVRGSAAATDPVQAVAAVVAELCDRAGLEPRRVQHVALGVPGSYDGTTGVIRHIDVPGWGRPGLVAELTETLAIPVDVENDVNLVAIAERSRGVAADADSFALIWFGPGLGLAIDLGGALVRGARGGAGEIGYVPVGVRHRAAAGAWSSGRRGEPESLDRAATGAEPEPPQGGRNRADLQDLLGERGVLALAAEYGIAPVDTAEAAVRAAVEQPATPAAGRAGGEAFLDALAERIAWGVAAVVAVLDPALIVLAGDLARTGGEALTDRVAAALRSTTPLDTTIAVTGIAGDPVLLGALDAALRAVRETLIDDLRNSVPAA